MRPRQIFALFLAAIALLAGAAPTLAAGNAQPRSLAASQATATYSPETEECAFLGLINAYRTKNGLGTLALSLTLGAAANHHSNDMASKNYFSHDLIDGTSWSQNISNYGYPTNTARAENIAAGYGSAADTFTQWKNSSGHNANMLGSGYNAIGIGRAYKTGSTYGYYWTTDFGNVVDKTVTCSKSSSAGASSFAIFRQRPILEFDQLHPCLRRRFQHRWHSTGTAPKTAYVWFDLGKSRAIGEIAWMFAKTGGADTMKIQVSTDKSTWKTIATLGNAKSAKSWQKLNWTGSARYVRFYFENPNKDAVVGYLAEVEDLRVRSVRG